MREHKSVVARLPMESRARRPVLLFLSSATLGNRTQCTELATMVSTSKYRYDSPCSDLGSSLKSFQRNTLVLRSLSSRLSLRATRSLSMPLREFYFTKTHHVSSVVAIHGIGAHPDETWCEDVGQDGNSAPLSVNWLQDPGMLPLAMKDARIMRYGYRSEWFGRDALIQNASTIAPDLLDALNRTRKVYELLSFVNIPKCACPD